MVKAGLAWWYEHYAKRDRELQTLEHDAREAKRGLWSDPTAIPPWDFRRTKN
jgi:micrococcal nuclease